MKGTTAMNKLILTAFAIAGLGLSGSAASAGSSDALTMKPVHGISFDVGSKRAVSYFQNDRGLCNLTLMIAEAMNGDEVPSGTAARFRVAVGAGKSTRLDTTEGKSLDFACSANARAMSVNVVDRVAAGSRPPR